MTRELDRGSAQHVGGGARVASLTGIRAVAALLVVATHAAYTTGKYPRGYVGLVYSRLEIGVPIFFVLSGFLLFRPWVRAAMRGGPRKGEPSVRRYARHRVRRIMPAYVVTVLGAYLLWFPKATVRVVIPFFILIFIPIPVPAWLMIGLWFLQNLLSGYATIADAAAGGGGVAWFAHIGGFLFGMLVAMAAGRQRKRPAPRLAR